MAKIITKGVVQMFDDEYLFKGDKDRHFHLFIYSQRSVVEAVPTGTNRINTASSGR